MHTAGETSFAAVAAIGNSPLSALETQKPTLEMHER
jgi:hypothetical protein